MICVNVFVSALSQLYVIMSMLYLTIALCTDRMHFVKCTDGGRKISKRFGLDSESNQKKQRKISKT